METLAKSHRTAFSLIELVIAIAVIGVLLSILLPSLHSARSASHREQCAHNLSMLGVAWGAYLDDHNQQFPVLLAQPAWQWGGARFSAVNGEGHLDLNRPLSMYVSAPAGERTAVSVLECPADTGIESDLDGAGTGGRSAFRSFGASYRANSFLLTGWMSAEASDRRPISRDALLAPPAAMVLIGDAGWYEQQHQTGRTAHWHGDDGQCNLLFLDGSVREQAVGADAEPNAVVFECALRESPASSSDQTNDKHP